MTHVDRFRVFLNKFTEIHNTRRGLKSGADPTWKEVELVFGSGYFDWLRNCYNMGIVYLATSAKDPANGRNKYVNKING